jgi:Cu-processing system permease protein
MTLLLVAADVVREAFARRVMLALLVAIVGLLLLLTLALDLEVVQGALAAGRLFGQDMQNAIVPVDVAMRGVFEALSLVTFYVGLLFGVVISADIAPKLLAPGRVELLLSLPVRRVELVVGTYLGVALIAALTTGFAVGGVSLVLFLKTGFVTSAPLWGALFAIVGFICVYAAMLLATSLVRSAALAAGTGTALYFAGILTSDRERFFDWFSQGWTRELLGLLVSPLPRLAALADAGGAAATGEGLPGNVVPLVLSALVFAAACVALAAAVISGKDY